MSQKGEGRKTVAPLHLYAYVYRGCFAPIKRFDLICFNVLVPDFCAFESRELEAKNSKIKR